MSIVNPGGDKHPNQAQTYKGSGGSAVGSPGGMTGNGMRGDSAVARDRKAFDNGGPPSLGAGGFNGSGPSRMNGVKGNGPTSRGVKNG